MKINPLATLDDVQPDDIDSGPVVILNLLKFKPGGSLAGVLAEPLPDELRRAIGSHLPPDIDKMEAIARLAVDSALRTLNQKLLAEIFDRLDPKRRHVEHTVERSHEDELPDLSKLTDEELDLLAELHEKVSSR